MTDQSSMKRFFSILIYINGGITVVLSLLILANLWIPNFFSSHDTLWKVVVSYAVVMANFGIFIKMDRKLSARDQDDSAGK